MPLALLRRLVRPNPAPTLRAETPRTEALAPIRLIDGTTIPVELRRQPRAKRLAIRISPRADAVILVVPPGVAPSRALQFLHSRESWIAAHWQTLPVRIRFLPDAVIPVLGRERRLVALGASRSRPTFLLTETTIEVAGDPAHLARRTRQGLASLASPMLAARAAALASALGKPLGRVSIGDPKARWGSCSSSGDLRFSWRLMLMPEPVVDYVVAHEVAHLVHMHHGPDFWRLVETLYPGHAAERAWLKRHGAEIMRYG
jgi:predicted metal-dependent hydrolase